MFSSVKNWLTLLIVALVALAMLVAWVYVVPPLQGRLTDRKLIDARENARLVRQTLTAPGLMTYDYSRGQLVIVNSDAVTQTLNIIGARFSGRAIIYRAQPRPGA